MELIRGLQNLRPRHRGCVCTLGAFDGVHKGHQKVLSTLMAKGQELGLPTTVVIFEPLPREYFSPKDAPPRLMNLREKFRALAQLGIDRLLVLPFTTQLRSMGANEFADEVFLTGLDTRYMIIGDDLRFGRDRTGDFELLKKLGKQNGFDVVATETQSLHGERISSTRIRRTLESSDFGLAAELLGRPYSISGRVTEGQQLGRQLGTPTANVKLNRLRSPINGVYAVEVAIQGKGGSGTADKHYLGVANVGTRPTVDDGVKAILEVHILDFNQDIYRQHIDVFFKYKIRDEKKFASIDELKEQIAKDIKTSREYFVSAKSTH